jgi:outer membrane protein
MIEALMRSLMAMMVTAAFVVAAPVAQAETLGDALIAAYKNSNLLDQNRALLKAADEDVAVAVGTLQPVVNFTINSGFTRSPGRSVFGSPTGEQVNSLSTTFTLSAEMTLIDFGRNRLAIEVAKESVLATREALVNIEQDVLLDAVTAYVNVRLATEIVDLRKNNLRLITQELRAAQDRFEVGEITRTDVSLAEARLAGSRSNLAAAEGDLLVAREAYKAATGAYPGNLQAVPPSPKTARTQEEATEIALRTHPRIRQSQREVAIAGLNVARAKAAMEPTLTAQGAIRMDDQGNETDTLSLELNQTLYAGGRLSAALRQNLAREEANRAALLQNGVLVGQAVGNAWSNLLVTSASIEATQRQIVAQQAAFDGVREEATLGARTTLDVLDAEQDLLDARAAKLQAEAQRYVGVYSLLSAMGLLTAEHLDLGIVTYDPAAYYNVVKDAPVHSNQGAALDRILKRLGE